MAGITGDFRLDAFATRLSHYRSAEQDLESLISLAVSKPSRDWIDQDIEAAIMQFGAWAFSLRQAEALAPLQDRDKTRHALAVIFGPSNGTAKTISRVVEVSPQEKKKAAVLATRIPQESEGKRRQRRIFLARTRGGWRNSGLRDGQAEGSDGD